MSEALSTLSRGFTEILRTELHNWCGHAPDSEDCELPFPFLAHVCRLGLNPYGINGLFAKVFFVLCGLVKYRAITEQEWFLICAETPIRPSDKFAALELYLWRAPLLAACVQVARSIQEFSVQQIDDTQAECPPPANDAFSYMLKSSRGTPWAKYATALRSCFPLVPVALTVGDDPVFHANEWMQPYIRRVLKDAVRRVRVYAFPATPQDFGDLSADTEASEDESHPV
jgi:hypothetical protein